MQIRVTADQAATYLADFYLDLRPQSQMSASLKAAVLRVEKFNMIARGFSYSTVLLVMSAVLFFSVGTALFYFAGRPFFGRRWAMNGKNTCYRGVG